MSEDLGRFIAGLIATLKTESFEWQKRHHADLLKMREEKAIAEKRIQQKIEEMEVEFKSYRKKIEIKAEHDVRDFAEFLDSIDEMKIKIIEYYAEMPRPISLMIHHHATELLKEAWHNSDIRERFKQQNRLMELMLTVGSDLAELTQDDSGRKVRPEKTLKFISSLPPD